MMTAIALDDEPPALEIIEAYCAESEQIVLEKTFTQSTRAMDYLDKFPVDLIFLDINMPAINGIEFYKKIPHQMMVVFTTSYSEFAVESYELNAIDYLLKPYTFKRFQQAAEKAAAAYNLQNKQTETGFLTLRVDYGLVKVQISDILFIEGLDNYLKIHIQSGKPVVVRMTLKNLLEKLPGETFCRVHRSFIIPLNRIDSVRNKMITIAGEEIPLGKNYEDSFYALFKQ